MENKIEFILDLIELKVQNLKDQRLSTQRELVAYNPVFYSLLESLIAHFLDKYKIPYELVEQKWMERTIKNNSNPQ